MKTSTVRLAVLGDIHGNFPALEAAVSDARRIGVDDFIFTGDLLTGAAFPVETMQLIQSLHPRVIVRGNHEGYLASVQAGTAPDGWQTSPQWAGLRWTYRQLGDEAVSQLAALPAAQVEDFEGAGSVRVVHGSPNSPFEGLVPLKPDVVNVFRRAGILAGGRPVPLTRAVQGVDETVLVCGHTHIPWSERVNGCLGVNPGAAGASIVGSPASCYAILEGSAQGWYATLHSVPYDLRPVREACINRGLLEEGGVVTRALLLNAETGWNVALALIEYAYRLAGVDWPKSRLLPDEIWARAEATFDWEGACQGRLVF